MSRSARSGLRFKRDTGSFSQTKNGMLLFPAYQTIGAWRYESESLTTNGSSFLQPSPTKNSGQGELGPRRNGACLMASIEGTVLLLNWSGDCSYLCTSVRLSLYSIDRTLSILMFLRQFSSLRLTTPYNNLVSTTQDSALSKLMVSSVITSYHL
jgi:hypothetical protein